MRIPPLARVALLLGIIAPAVAACAHTKDNKPPHEGVAPVDRSPPPSRPTALETRQAVIGAPAPHPAKLEVSEVEGTTASQLQTMFGRAAEPLHRCLPGQSPGKLILRVTSKNGVLSVVPVAGFRLDDAGRSCAFEALSQIYLSETGSNTGGVSIPPSGFTSLFTVAW
ncbi:MAG: hypothetical protein JST00_38585 [Deltaproteobacteria bacterium]|nr:hypothetical protein [Deltaproteobacteria bacterium]